MRTRRSSSKVPARYYASPQSSSCLSSLLWHARLGGRRRAAFAAANCNRAETSAHASDTCQTSKQVSYCVYLSYSEVRLPLALETSPSNAGSGPWGRTLPRGDDTMYWWIGELNGNEDGSLNGQRLLLTAQRTLPRQLSTGSELR
jgi:hypothetical protein